jgi:hypothetical protein
MIKVTCLLTKGGRRDGTETVLWTCDMTEAQYDRHLDRELKALEERAARRKQLKRRGVI